MFRPKTHRIYFNPLPRKEGDIRFVHSYKLSKNFNPLPRKEGDASIYGDVNYNKISIHSLVKRETANFAKIWLNRILILCTFLLEHKKF